MSEKFKFLISHLLFSAVGGRSAAETLVPLLLLSLWSLLLPLLAAGGGDWGLSTLGPFAAVECLPCWGYESSRELL